MVYGKKTMKKKKYRKRMKNSIIKERNNRIKGGSAMDLSLNEYNCYNDVDEYCLKACIKTAKLLLKEFPIIEEEMTINDGIIDKLGRYTDCIQRIGDIIDFFPMYQIYDVRLALKEVEDLTKEINSLPDKVKKAYGKHYKKSSSEKLSWEIKTDKDSEECDEIKRQAVSHEKPDNFFCQNGNKQVSIRHKCPVLCTKQSKTFDILFDELKKEVLEFKKFLNSLGNWDGDSRNKRVNFNIYKSKLVNVVWNLLKLIDGIDNKIKVSDKPSIHKLRKPVNDLLKKLDVQWTLVLDIPRLEQITDPMRDIDVDIDDEEEDEEDDEEEEEVEEEEYDSDDEADTEENEDNDEYEENEDKEENDENEEIEEIEENEESKKQRTRRTRRTESSKGKKRKKEKKPKKKKK
jgi:hypothetical protein